MEKLKCVKCGYEWVKRIENIPKACPKCKTTNWQELKILPYKTKSKEQLKSYKKRLLVKITMIDGLLNTIAEKEKMKEVNENDSTRKTN